MRKKMKLTSTLFLFIILSSTVSAEAQWFRYVTAQAAQEIVPDDRYRGYPRELIRGAFPKTWPPSSEEIQACRDQEYYEPKDTHLTKYASRVKVVRIRVQDKDECTRMLTAHSDPSKRYRLVLRPKGTQVAVDAQGRDLFDYGSPTGKRCANPRPYSVPIPEEEPEPEPPAKKEPEPQKDPPPEEKKEEPKSPPTDKKEEPIKSRLGITASLTPYIDSIPVQSLVETFTNREVCLDGYSFDVGVAVGKPKSSFWRFTFAGMVVNDGSTTEYVCEDCNTRVKTVSRGMKVLGAKVERVFRFKKDWPIQPMATVHAGVGIVTGKATRFGREVKASEMFEKPVFPLVGAGIGLMGDIGNHWTYTVTAIGVEYPGLSYGRFGLTYWLKD